MRKYNNKISEKANKSLQKREIVVRRQKSLLAIVIIVLFSFGILLGSSISALASSKADVSSYNKYYTSIRLESGDTLWDIAEEYMTSEYETIYMYIDEVMESNHLESTNIKCGQLLILPYYADAPVTK